MTTRFAAVTAHVVVALLVTAVVCGCTRMSAVVPMAQGQITATDVRVGRGLFIVHEVGDRLLFEIPTRVFGRDMLFRGVRPGDTPIVRWERIDGRVVLGEVANDQTSGGSAIPVARVGTQKAAVQTIASFDIEAFGLDSAPIIDVTRLFTVDLPLATRSDSLLDADMRIARVAVFPSNVSVVVRQTTSDTEPDVRARPDVRPRDLRFNIVQLPKVPMMPRLFDPRVDLNSTLARNSDRSPHRTALQRRYVERFRLTKRDPGAATSEPVQPIVMWIDPDMPEWLVPHVKAGVAEWLPAFEAAGFRSAIIAREARDSVEDPNWSGDDVRHSVIRWEDGPNPRGPSGGSTDIDPRSGEILRGSVQFPPWYLHAMLRRYFVHSGPLDPRLQQFPGAPDSLLGRLVQNFIAHEVGHVIGLPQYDAWGAYPLDSLRRPSFLKKVSRHLPTIMGHQFNSIAQPEDSVSPELLVATVGVYDRFAIMWQSKPIPDARTPEEEQAILEEWLRIRDTIPWFRFTHRDAPNRRSDGAPEYADPLRASGLALKNIEGVFGMLRVRAQRPNAKRDLLNAAYREALEHWSLRMSQVGDLIGGVRDLNEFGAPRRAKPVSATRQREAMAFLAKHALVAPEFLLDSILVNYTVGTDSAVRLIGRAHAALLNSLLTDAKLSQASRHSSVAARQNDAYRVAELLGDIRRAVWGELETRRPPVASIRRDLQGAYLVRMQRLLRGPASVPQAGAAMSSSPLQDLQPLIRSELTTLEREIGLAVHRASDTESQSHLNSMHQRVRSMLREPSR